ncbi:hypothetical protein [Pleurocapsa sp. PCC 7319]|uniref:hypothetical protein n=1 Tax=Pleurocapsa sp. PCC 7319 TaxID=118161 RepID=UPI00034B42BD|nr:hypothetical protein [Pleurocapsa sp. PCC 7319]
MWDLEDCAKSSAAQFILPQELREDFDLNDEEFILDVGFDDDNITADLVTTLPVSKVADLDSSSTKSFSAKKNKQNNRCPSLSIISCGGKGDALGILQIFLELINSKSCDVYFSKFHNPQFLYGLQDYQIWLQKSGFEIKRLELVPQDMTRKEGLADWIRTIWMSFTKSVSENKRDNSIPQFVNLYLEKNPSAPKGSTHISMVRLEVDSAKTNMKCVSENLREC